MAGLSETIVILGVLGGVMLLIYAYVASIRRVLVTVGFTEGEASTLLMATLLAGWITIPVFPYNGWWVGLSIGGAVIPIILCASFLKSGRAGIGESFIGITIVAYITYTVTRAEEGVGIVADVPVAFAPSLAAGLYSLSVFWVDIRQAAPLAYVSGVLGTIVGADIFRLGEMLSFDAPEEGTTLLSIGGANIFDMVYLTGIVAVLIAMLVLWVKVRRDKLDYGMIRSPGGDVQAAPLAGSFESAPTIKVRKGKLE